MFGNLLAFMLAAIMFSLPLFAKSVGIEKGSQRAFYLVFELNEQGEPKLVFQRLVHMAVSSVSQNISQIQNFEEQLSADQELFIARVVAENGEQLFQQAIKLDRYTRIEFPAADGLTIEHQRILASDRSFVVRIPAYDQGTLVLKNERETRFSMGELAARTSYNLENESGITLSANNDQGDPANRVDILIMGDGYTDSEIDTFYSDVNDLTEGFYSTSPYKEYQNFFNTNSMFVPSLESGSDHPAYNEDCSTVEIPCCSDTAALSDPLSGSIVDTAFDTSFCTSNIHRLLGVDSSKVLAAASAVPDWEKIFLLVNDPTRGGSGGFRILIASTHSDFIETIKHEVGHSFTRLADEYESEYPGYPACSDFPDEPDSRICEANVTNVTNRPDVKWLPWIHEATPVPTPENGGFIEDVGLFEGARYLEAGMYRPKESCAMRYSNVDFCEICVQTFIKRLYTGWGGIPYRGIELIEPGSVLPAESVVETTGPVMFFIDVVQPSGGVDISWWVNGVIQSSETGSNFLFIPTTDGIYDIEVRVLDPTTRVHPAMIFGDYLQSTRSWNVIADGLPPIQINAGYAGAWFNPDSSGQGQLIDVEPEDQFMFVAWFTYTDADSDKPFEQHWFTAQGNYTGNTAELDLFETLGGKFDDLQMATTTKIGEVTLSFSSCGQGRMRYNIYEEGLQAEFPLVRVIPSSDNVCESLGGNTTQAVDINAGMDGAWFDSSTSGQGFFIDSHPDPAGGNFIFVSWFTYGDETASGQRWLTAQGSFEGSIAEIDVFESNGGSFDDPLPPSTTQVGTMSIDFTDCNNAQLTYSLPAESAAGDIAITRVIPGGQALCEELTGAE